MPEIQNAAAGLNEAGLGESRFDDSRVLSAVQEYLAALESGRAVDRQEFIARHPEIATELEECLDALQIVHGAAPQIRFELGDDGAHDAPAPKLLGDFRLLRELGRGGMGVVYEAVQISLNRRVAVKVLPFAAALDQTHLQRFRNEAQAAAQLHHTNIVPVYAVGVERGVHYFAMQLIEGEPLANLIAYLRQLAGKPSDALAQGHAAGADCPTRSFNDAALEATNAFGLTSATITSPAASPSSARLVAGNANNGRFRLAAELMRQAAVGLEHAHQFGVVHRDVKPGNLLVNEQGNLWITDFGLAHVQADVSLTRTGDVLGTVRYMSPEQAAGDRVVLDHRTDIYSLGATFYELLTLEPLFAEVDRHVLLRRIIEDEPHPPRSVEPSIPLELETIVLKAMAKAPQDRYSTAKQLADDLQRWLDDLPILARRPTLRERAVKFGRRHRSLVKMAAGFLGLVFVGLLASTILIAWEHSKTRDAYRREMNQRLAADESFRQARQAVETFTQLAEQELADDPGLQTVRRKFLETALDYYESFLKQRRDDPAVQAELTATSSQVEKLIDDLAAVEGFAALPLLGDRHVQQELALGDTQREVIERELDEFHRARREAREGSGSDEPAARPAELADVLRSRQQKIARLLNASQMLRLKQIYWQQQGPFAFLTSEVATALALTPQQRSDIRRVIDESNPAHRGAPEGGPHRHGPPPQGGRPFGADPPSPPDGSHGEHEPFDDRGPPLGGPGGQRPGPRRFGPPPHPWEIDGPPPPGPGGPGGAGPQQHVRENLEQAVEQILSLLTDEQRRVWQTLIGQKFAVELMSPGSRPR